MIQLFVIGHDKAYLNTLQIRLKIFSNCDKFIKETSQNVNKQRWV